MADRVHHVVSSLQVGGAERLVVDLACAQIRAGLSPSIVDLGRDDGPLAAAAHDLGIDVIRVGRLRSTILRTAALAAMIAGRDRVLHIHNPWALRAVLPILPTVRGRVIYTRHGAHPYNRRPWRMIHRLARRFIHRVTFVTDDARESYEVAHGSSWERHVVIENGVMVASEVPARSPPVRLRIGAVGRLVELKGQHVLLDAIAGLEPGAREHVEVHVFGDGPERERLAGQAKATLPGTEVVFHGTVLDRERIYDKIDVLAIASRTEGQSMALMEAMARGVPVIATSVGGNPQLVRDGTTGMLVPVGDPAAIRAAIARMIGEPELVVRFGRASHAHIAANHSIDAVAKKYSTLYA